MKHKKTWSELLKKLEVGPESHHNDDWFRVTLDQCREAIAHLEDENESLWTMLDELKKSEIKSWAKNNDTMLQEYVDNHIKSLKWQNKIKGEA